MTRMMVERRRRPAVFLVLVAAVLVGHTVLTAVAADAHGAMTLPGSRTYLCRIDGTHSTGDIVPNNPACADAIAIGGKQPLWDWFGVLRSDGAGRTRGYIPDGQLCSGGEPKYAGYDQARADWPHTSLTAGATMTFRYNAWAHHPGEFRLYITRPGYDPTQPLRWDDLEDQPFTTYAQSSPNGQDEANGTPDYQWSAALPQRTGRHIIYSVWERSDSTETFYGCSDVVFDGGGGQVVNIGSGATPVAPLEAPAGQPTTTAPAPTTDGPASTMPSTALPGAGDPAADPTAQADDPVEGADGVDGAVGEPAAMVDVAGQEVAPPAVGPAAVASATGTGTEPAGAVPAATGSGWGAMVLVGLVGVTLGAVATMAVFWYQRSRRLEDELRHLRRSPTASGSIGDLFDLVPTVVPDDIGGDTRVMGDEIGRDTQVMPAEVGRHT